MSVRSNAGSARSWAHAHVSQQTTRRTTAQLDNSTRHTGTARHETTTAMVEHVVKPFQDHLVFLALCSCGLSLARKVSCDREYVEYSIGAISNNNKQSPQVARFPWMCCNRCFFAFSQKLQNATRQKIQLTAVACGHSTSRKRVSSTKAGRRWSSRICALLQRAT